MIASGTMHSRVPSRRQVELPAQVEAKAQPESVTGPACILHSCTEAGCRHRSRLQLMHAMQAVGVRHEDSKWAGEIPHNCMISTHSSTPLHTGQVAASLCRQEGASAGCGSTHAGNHTMQERFAQDTVCLAVTAKPIIYCMTRHASHLL